MRFRHKLFNRVQSDSGFFVKIRAFQGFVEYREGGKVAIIPVEPVIGQPLVHVYKNTVVKWNPPYSNEVISEGRNREILQNIAEAMRFRKYNVEIV